MNDDVDVKSCSIIQSKIYNISHSLIIVSASFIKLKKFHWKSIHLHPSSWAKRAATYVPSITFELVETICIH